MFLTHGDLIVFHPKKTKKASKVSPYVAERNEWSSNIVVSRTNQCCNSVLESDY